MVANTPSTKAASAAFEDGSSQAPTALDDLSSESVKLVVGRHDDAHADSGAGDAFAMRKPLSAAGTKQASAIYGSIQGQIAPSASVPAVCWYILVVELCERLSFYTIAGSQEFFLEHIGFPLGQSGGLNATMWTLCSVFTIFASWMADVGLGRYHTILASGLLYILATVTSSFGAVPGKENAWLYLFGVMVLLPIGTAGIKANISNFGADQYDESDPAQKAAQEEFFSIFYCSINLGAAVAFGFFTTFATSGGFGVPKEWGYAVAYGAMSFCMMLAVGIFVSGRSKYVNAPLQRRSALASLLDCLTAAARRGSGQSASVLAGLVLLLVSIVLSVIKALAPSMGDALMVLAFASAAGGTAAIVLPCLEPSWVLQGTGNAEQQDVRSFLALMPPLFTGSLAFNALYNCMQFWYQQQACQMDLRMPFGNSDAQISGSFFNIADCLAIVLVTPIVVTVLNPWMERVAHGPIGHGRKFSIGMLIALTSVVIAGLLEVRRREMPVLSIASNCAPAGVNMSDISGAWITVPYFLMGVAEIYTQPTLLHLSYSKSPPSMRTLAMAASFFIAAVSSAIFALLVAAMGPFIPNDLNEGHLEYGYCINIVIGFVFLLFFLRIVRAE